MPIAPAGSAGTICRFCGRFATMEQEDEAAVNHVYECACGQDNLLGRKAGLLPTFLPFIKDTSLALNTTWYHATTHSDWLKELRDSSRIPMVHVGTERAAQMRKLISADSASNKGRDWSLYEITLLPDTEVGSRVLDDFNADAPNWSTDDDAHPFYAMDGATCYMNYYEHPGSISLVLNSTQMSVKNLGKM